MKGDGAEHSSGGLRGQVRHHEGHAVAVVLVEDGDAQGAAELACGLTADAFIFVLETPRPGGWPFGLMRAAASEPEATKLIRQVLTKHMMLPLVERVGTDRPELRASRVASQYVGIVMARSVVRIEALASSSRKELVRALAAVFDHHLFGDWVTEADKTQTTGRSPS